MSARPRAAVHRLLWPLIAILSTTYLTHAQAPPTSETVVKAAMLYNFTKFIEWPSPVTPGPLRFCVLGRVGIADALIQAIRGKTIDGRALAVRAMGSDEPLSACDVVFVDASETQRAALALKALRARPVMTVSDGKGFARTDGIIEFFVEDGRLRFAINTDAADRAGVHLSSRLLGLARIVKDADAR